MSRCQLPLLSTSLLVAWRLVQQGLRIGLIPEDIQAPSDRATRLLLDRARRLVPHGETAAEAAVAQLTRKSFGGSWSDH